MRNAGGKAEDQMAFEFILVALIDAQEPMSLKRYDNLAECHDSARELQEFVKNGFNISAYKETVKTIDKKLVEYGKKFDELLDVYEKFYTITVRTTFDPQKELERQTNKSADRHRVHLLDQLLRLQILINAADRERNKAKQAIAAAGDHVLFPAQIKYGCLPAPE